MKLHTDRNDVERFNVGTESSFKIKTTAKAFDILSSGLYTDRVLAVVRELSCNAYDAHIAAGNDKPFEIHVPNQLEPWFSVKDQGTGLSDEDVMNLYSTYFDSTKTNSNDYIGALGLGSKSPFSYTKAFEVISCHENVRRLYSVFINEDGVPTIAKMGEFVTEEHNGLEVKVTVKKDDFWTFQEKVRKALRWFPVKPTIVGVSRFEWPEMPKESLSGEGWAMFDNNFTDDYSKMTAVQGNVSYKVDISKLSLNDADTGLLENCHIVGFFKIGQLEVSASREEIRYDDRSVRALIKRVKDVRAGILASVEKKVETLQNEGKSNWEIMIALNDMAEEMFNSKQTFNSFLEDSKNDAIKWYVTSGGTLKLPDMHGHEVMGYTLSYGSSDKAPIKKSYYKNGLEPSKEMAVFCNDMKIGGVAKIGYWIRTMGAQANPRIRTVIAIRRTEKTNLFEELKKGELTPKNIEWTDEQYEEEFDLIRVALGDVQIKLASTDAPVPPRGRNGDYKLLAVFQFDKVRHNRHRDDTVVWNRVVPDFENGGLFVYIRNGSKITLVDSAGKEQDVSWDVSKTEEYLKASIKMVNNSLGTSYTMKDLYAIGSVAAKKIKKFPNWVNLFDILKTQMDGLKPAVEFFKKVGNTGDVLGLRDAIVQNNPHRSSSRKNLIERLGKLNKKSVFKNTLEPFITDVENYEKMRDTCAFMQKLDLDLGTKIYDNLDTKGYYANRAFEVYPMLTFVSQYQYLNTQQIELFFDYIANIDRS